MEKQKSFKNSFGLTPDNPIPCSSIPAGYSYLSFLVDENQEKVQHDRVGPVNAKNIPNPIDQYKITDSNGNFLCYIYIDAYARRDTEESPECLQYFRPLKSAIEIEEEERITEEMMKDPELRKKAEFYKKLSELQYGEKKSGGCLVMFSLFGSLFLVLLVLVAVSM